MSLSLTTTGVGLSANIAGIASLTQCAAKWEIDAAAMQALSSGATGVAYGIWNIDSDGAGTNPKLQLYVSNDASHHISFTLKAQGLGSVSTPFCAISAFPASGTAIVVYSYWANGTEVISVTNTAGTVLTDGTNNCSVSASLFDGALVTTGGANGRVSVNWSLFAAGQATIYMGGAFYSAALVGAAQYSAPASGDANIVGLWKLNDASSGTTPSTAAATVGSQGLVLTTSQFTWASAPAGAWFPGQVATSATISPTGPTLIAGGSPQQYTGTILDAGASPIVGEPVTWTSSNTAVATVNSTGLATGVAPGSTTIKVADTGTPSVNASSTLNVQTAGTLSLTNAGKGLAGLVTGLANIQTTMSVKWVQKVDSLRTLGAALAVSSSAVGALDADGADTSHKCCWGWNVRANGNLSLMMHIFGQASIEGPNASYTTLSANGTYVICEIDVVNGAQHFNVCLADGSTLVAGMSGSAAFTNVANLFPTSGSPGRLTLNKDPSTSQFVQQASVYAGMAIYNTVLTGANRFSAPVNTDTGLQAGWYLADASSGSSPSTAAAFAGGQGLVLTNNTYLADLSLWAPSAGQVPTTATVSPSSATLSPAGTTQLTGTILDGSTNPIVGEPVTWSSSNTGVATVSGTGLVTAVAVGTATITVADNANSAVTATSAITVTGIGTLSLTSAGTGLSANVPAAASIASTMSMKWVQQTDALRSLGANQKMPAWASDQDGAGTNVKWQIGWVTDGAGNIGLAFHVPGIGGPVGPAAAQTSLPGNGNYIICEVDVVNNSQNFNVYNAAGTLQASFSGHTAYNLGAANWGTTPGANGRITLNKDPGGYFGGQAANVYGGGALYSSTLTGGALLSAPSASDPGIVAGWLMNDAKSGSVPATAAALAGGQALVLTNNTWTSNASAWTAAQVPTTATVSPTSSTITSVQTLQLTGTILDAGMNPISGESVTWSTSNASVATVSATGLVTAVTAGTCTITVADASAVAVSATCALTVTAAAPTTTTLTCTAYATADSSQPIVGKVPTWTTSNAAIATVDSTGMVAGVAAGTATITGTIDGKSDTCTVTVT